MAEVHWGLTWLLWRQRLERALDAPVGWAGSLPERLRRLRGLAPDPATASLYWCEPRALWIFRPHCHPLHTATYESSERAFDVGGDAAPEALADAVLRVLADCRYGPTPDAPPSARDWTRFVREHRLIHLSRTRIAIELEAHVRVHQGRGGCYVPAPGDPLSLPLDADPDALGAALERALGLCRELEREW